MFAELIKRWSNWTGDKRLTEAIRRELRNSGYAVSTAEIRQVRLAAIERPGWVQVYRFAVATSTRDENPHKREEVMLLGLSREDGRKTRIDVLLTKDEIIWRKQLDEWSDGLIKRG